MCDFERVEVVDVAIGVDLKAGEYVGLKGVGRFHYEGVEVEPPEPSKVSEVGVRKRTESLPFGLWIFSHGVADGVNFLPTLAPFVCVPLFGAHVHNFKVVTPHLGVSFLVFNAITLDSPFSRSLPFHHTPTLIGPENDNEFTASAKRTRSPIPRS